MHTKIRSESGARFMPQGKVAHRILRERAERLAKPRISDTVSEEATTYIRFQLGEKNEFYGIPYTCAKEVLQHVTPTPIPYAPSFIAGVINRRGVLLAVLDLKKFFFNVTTEYNANAYIIIVTAHGMTVGVLADYVSGSDTFEPTLLDMPLQTEGGIKPEYVIGLHQGMTAILNIEALMGDPQILRRSA